MNYLRLGAKVLHDSMQAYAGDEVTYRRGDRVLKLVAVPGRVTTEVQNEDGMSMRLVTRDFMIKISDLASLDPPYPLRNDVIVQGNEQFIVNGEDLFGSHYEEADSYQQVWRVHTRKDKHAIGR